MQTDIDYSDQFVASQRAVAILLSLSALWVAFNGAAVIPVGLLATIHYVGRNYDTTFFASLRKGWRLVAYSAAISAVTWALVNASFNIWAKDGATGFAFSLVNRGYFF